MAGSDCAASTSADGAVPIVGADEDDVRVGKGARGRDEMLDPLARSDPPHGEHERRTGRNTGRRPRGRAAVRDRGLGEPVAAHDDALGLDPPGEHVVALELRGHDDSGGVRRDAARDGRVEGALEPHLA